MILKCKNCGLAISIREKNGYVILSESELLPSQMPKKSNTVVLIVKRS